MAMSKLKVSNLMHLLNIDPSRLKNATETDLRLKVQKIVYLLEYIGEPGLDYPYSIYLRGPYSTALAKDYYSIDTTEKGSINNEGLAEWFFEKNVLWQEVAATTLMIHKQHHSKPEDEFEVVKNLKPWVTFDKYLKIIEELKGKGIEW